MRTILCLILFSLPSASPAAARLCPEPGSTIRAPMPPEHIEWRITDSGDGYFGVLVKASDDIEGMRFSDVTAVRHDGNTLAYALPVKTTRFYNGNVEFSFLADEIRLRRIQFNLRYRNPSLCPGVEYIYAAIIGNETDE